MEKNFINQAEVDKVQAAVEQVWPGLRLSIFGHEWKNEAQCINVGVIVAEKGNKAKIQALKEMGFRKAYRELKGPPGHNPYYYLRGERSYYVTLRKDL